MKKWTWRAYGLDMKHDLVFVVEGVNEMDSYMKAQELLNDLEIEWDTLMSYSSFLERQIEKRLEDPIFKKHWEESEEEYNKDCEKVRRLAEDQKEYK
jgi:hypothetical protein